MSEIDQPLTELVERAWKILYRFGHRSMTNPRSDGGYDDRISFKLENWDIWSKNRFLRISKKVMERPVFGQPQFVTIISVDEEGEIGSLDVVECAIALERFRAYTILDDLAEASE